MIRPCIIAVSLLGVACATHRETPALYDFDSVAMPSEHTPQLDAPITVTDVSAPSWLRSASLIYRLNYKMPARAQPYAHSQWSAPPAELLTVRLREMLAGANSGFTTTRLGAGPAGYQLEVRLQRFEQDFTSSSESRCIVRLEATLVGSGGSILGQRMIEVERPSPAADAAGGVRGLVEATDDAIGQLIDWMRSTLHAQGFNQTAEQAERPASQQR